MIPSHRLLPQRADLTRPDEALDDDARPVATTTVLALAARCQVAPLSTGTVAQLRQDSGSPQADATLHLGPDAPELRPGDQATLDTGQVWTVTAPPAEHYSRDGTLGRRDYLVVAERAGR